MSRWQVLVYSLAHFGKGLLWHSSGIVFAFYLTEVVGLTPKAMGWALGGSFALSALMDLWLGRLLSRHVQSVGAAGAAQAIGAVAAAIAFVAFAATALLPESVRMAAAVGALLVFRLAYAAFDLPENAILALGCRTDADRVRLAAARYISAGVAVLTLTLLITPWVTTSDPGHQAVRFFELALLFAGVVIAGSTALFVATRRVDRRAEDHDEAAAIGGGTAPLTLALVAIAIYSTLMPLFGKLEPYFVAFALPPGISSWFMTSVACGQVLGQFAWARLGARIGILGLFRCAAGAVILSTAAFATFAMVQGVTPLMLGFAYGAASNGLVMAIWAWLASAARDRATTTIRFGQFTFCSKVAHAFGAWGFGHFLALTQYRTSEGAAAIVLVMAGAPALAAAVCLAVSVLAGRDPQVTRAAMPV